VGVTGGPLMSTEFLHQPHEPVNPPPAQTFPPPPWPGHGEAVDWAQPHGRRRRPSRSRPTTGPGGETTAGHCLAVRADHGRARSRTRLGTARHLGCHPHEESPAPRSLSGRDRLRADRPVGDSRSGRRPDGRTRGHFLHGADRGAPPPTGLVAPTTVPATVSPAPVAPSRIPGHQPHAAAQGEEGVLEQLKTGTASRA
jgi:hypothetical protein